VCQQSTATAMGVWHCSMGKYVLQPACAAAGVALESQQAMQSAVSFTALMTGNQSAEELQSSPEFWATWESSITASICNPAAGASQTRCSVKVTSVTVLAAGRRLRAHGSPRVLTAAALVRIEFEILVTSVYEANAYAQALTGSGMEGFKNKFAHALRSASVDASVEDMAVETPAVVQMYRASTAMQSTTLPPTDNRTKWTVVGDVSSTTKLRVAAVYSLCFAFLFFHQLVEVMP